MKYTIDKQEQFTLINLHEEKLDSTLAPQLKSDFVSLHTEGTRNVILDLKEVKYIDSSGLSALLVGNRITNDGGGILVITSISDHVIKLIKISQLDSILNILPSVEEARDAVFMHEIEGDMKEDENGH
jgi:anti-anti-sigma factor